MTNTTNPTASAGYFRSGLPYNRLGYGPWVQPVGLIWQEGRYLVSIPSEAAYQPASGQEAVLLVDEGIYYFDLRAIYIRGTVRPVEAPSGISTSRVWFELVPLKTVAWDYGSMREVENERWRSHANER
jgi:hypothetical protein